MPQDVDYKPFFSISIPAEQRQLFYRSLAQIRQHYPFTTKSALVVQAIIAAARQEQQLPRRYRSPSKKDKPTPGTALGTRGLHRACSRRFRKGLALFCGLYPLLLSASLLLSLARAASMPDGEGRH